MASKTKATQAKEKEQAPEKEEGAPDSPLPLLDLSDAGVKKMIKAAKKRLHHNVLAIALANKLARIAWAVLNKERNFQCISAGMR